MKLSSIIIIIVLSTIVTITIGIKAYNFADAVKNAEQNRIDQAFNILNK